MVFIMILWHHCHPRVVVSYASLLLCFTFLYLLSLVLSSLACYKGDTMFFGQGTTSVLRVTRKGSVGGAPRCCFGKVNLPADVSSSRAMVVMLKGAFIVSCSPGVSPLVYIHYSMNTVFKASLVGIQFTDNQSTLRVTFPFPWDYQVLVWHHCHHVFTSS